MKIENFDGPIGAEVTGVDLWAIADADFEKLYRAWIERGVIRIRDQQLDDIALQTFSARFGPLKEIPVLLSEAERSQLPSLYVTVISNIVVNGEPIGGLANKEAAWHSDMTYIETPPPASILHAIEVPAKGGDTQFACQVAALKALPEDLLSEISGISIKHDASHTSIGNLRRGFEEVEDVRKVAGVAHPIIKRHEESGHDALFLGRRDFAYVEGLEIDESEELLDRIWRYAVLPQNVWTQHWRVGDVIIWDNRRVLHRRDDFDQAARRLMKRCQVLAREAPSTSPIID
ncbi:MAG: TauD/TfdA family dioxygenase [Myxococcota bacterium]